MNMLRMAAIVLVSTACCAVGSRPVEAQCCLSGMFSGCTSCFKKQPVYAVAPVAPVAAPIVPMPAPPPPVMVPVQQTSYVPETTYRTEYKCVPVTSYKPSCEVDPCTGCTVECMQPVTQYVQQAVNVPVTQYRAVTTTKYVQMQPGYNGAAVPAAPGVPMMPATAPAASPFSAVQTTPQAWGAAGADVSRQPLPGVAPPALPATPAQASPTYQQYQPVAPPAFAPQVPMIQGSSAQTITPQSGTYAPAQPLQPVQPQATQAPALTPAPSLRPIPDLPRTGKDQTEAAAGTNARTNAEATGGGTEPPASGSTGAKTDSPAGMPIIPGDGPGAATGAFPRLLEPTSHTTSWGPSDVDAGRVQYPTAALPAWRQAQR